MTDFITSDIHFSHRNIMNFCPVTRARFNNDVEFMDNEIIREWNQKVSPRDHTYILGDVAFCNAGKAVGYLSRMNGSKTLICGNHDTKLLKSKDFDNCFDVIQDYYSITVDGVKCIMFHYPIAEWDQCHRGSVHFHGHLHGNPSGLEQYRALDVGMDATGEVVITLEEAIKRALVKMPRGHGNSKENM